MSLSFDVAASELDYILSPQAIRERSHAVLAAADSGKTNFSIDRDSLPEVAQFVAKITRENYPSLEVPFHSRWKHFQVGGFDRLRRFYTALQNRNRLEQLRSKVDLVIISVLVDAGAGMKWKFRDSENDYVIGKSEGLAVASLFAFLKGLFSSSKDNPLQVDAEGLERLSWEQFQLAFQLSEQNPMDGDRGRFELLKNLGRTLRSQSAYFGKSARLGNLAEHWDISANSNSSRSLLAASLLRSLQDSLGSIWPGRVSINGFNVGDVWPCPALGSGLEGLMPFHKLSQWLSYSLIDPITDAGIRVDEIPGLTGLAEYRNGGLFLDFGIIKARDPLQMKVSHRASDPFIVEWRALTLALLDELAPLVRSELGLSERQLPLGKVLEGGTWWAGRKIAAKLRTDGSSPLQLISDGTVF